MDQLSTTPLRPFDLSQHRAREPLLISTVFCGIATISTIARFSARLAHKAGLKWDDWIILMTLLLSYGNLIIYWCGKLLGHDHLCIH